MIKNRAAVALLTISSVWMLGGTAWSQTPAAAPASGAALNSASVTTTSVSDNYSDFAGSAQNAQALVVGLRDGSAIQLTASAGVLSAVTPSATFTPVTGKLGLGNVDIALSLPKADLAKVGIANPTPTQLQAALNGGTFATTSGPVTLGGVLVQRQSGLGWGQIANSMGVKLGALVSSAKTDKMPSKKEAAAASNAHSVNGMPGKSGESHSGGTNGHSGGNSSGGNSGGGNSSSGGNSGGGSKK